MRHRRKVGSERRAIGYSYRSVGTEGAVSENLNRQVLLKRRPTGLPRTEDFEIADAPLPDPLEGEVLVRGIYLSLDQYMCGSISGVRPYAAPVELGAGCSAAWDGCASGSGFKIIHRTFRDYGKSLKQRL